MAFKGFLVENKPYEIVLALDKAASDLASVVHYWILVTGEGGHVGSILKPGEVVKQTGMTPSLAAAVRMKIEIDVATTGDSISVDVRQDGASVRAGTVTGDDIWSFAVKK